MTKKKQKEKNYTTYNTIACVTTYNVKTNTTHNYLHYNCKTTHTHNTHTHTRVRNHVLQAQTIVITTGTTCHNLVIEMTII